MTRHVREPDVSPFMDVLLVLVMWCGLTTFIWRMERSIDVRLDRGLGEPGLPPDTMTVVAARHQTILRDGQPVRVADMKNRVVLVRADTNVSYQDVVHALDVARGAGARALGLRP